MVSCRRFGRSPGLYTSGVPRVESESLELDGGSAQPDGFMVHERFIRPDCGYFFVISCPFSSGRTSHRVGMVLSPSRRALGCLVVKGECAVSPDSDLYSVLVRGQGRRK